MTDTQTIDAVGNPDLSRRDFLLVATATVGAVGAGLAVWPFVDSMNPAADTLALSSTEVDLEPIAAGQSITVVWRGKPVFVRHRRWRKSQPPRRTTRRARRSASGRRSRSKSGMVGSGRYLHPFGLHPARSETGGKSWRFLGVGSARVTVPTMIPSVVSAKAAPRNLVVPPYAFLTDTSIKIG